MSATVTRMKRFLCVSTLALTCTSFGQTILYVDDSATGLNNGSDWSNAYVELQSALAVAITGDEIRVAQGTYRPDYDVESGSHTGNRRFSFRLKNGVTLYGGYAGFGAGNPDLRDADLHKTILSGDLAGDDNPGFVNNSENSYHVVYANRADNTTELNGFIISGGNADGDYPDYRGGGMYNQRSNPTIANCIFTENSACTTYLSGEGGGLCNTLGGTPTITNCEFVKNAAGNGGGLYTEDGNPTISNCVFNENSAISFFGFGGGLFIVGGSPKVDKCLFTYNSANESAGGAIYSTIADNPMFSNCTFTNNHAYNSGGGIYNNESHPTFINCAFIQNTSLYEYGGGIYNVASNPTLSNCTLSRNAAYISGGGIYNRENSNPVLNNCILWDNRDRDGFDETGQIHNNNSISTITFSCIQGLNNYVGNGNIDIDPRLTRHSLHLQKGSPCIDQGDPSGNYGGQQDTDGESRVSGTAVDIGADEFRDIDTDGLPDWWEKAYYSSATAALPGDDPDTDGRTNLEEFAASTSHLSGPKIYYVSKSGDDSWDGLSTEWDGNHGPKATIQASIDATHRFEGDTVVILPGIYTGSGNRDLDYCGKAIEIRSVDPQNPTIVSQTVINCDGNRDAYHRGLRFHSLEGNDSVLNGLTVQGGYSYAGGAILCQLSNPKLENCNFKSNTAYNYSGSNAGIGGGIHNYGCCPTIVRCVFDSNSADCTSNSAYGGGISNYYSNPLITNCVFKRNYSAGWGGGIYNYRSESILRNCYLTGNTADYGGGGINNEGSDLILTNCVLTGNTTTTYASGGGMSDYTSSSTLANCILWNNTENSHISEQTQIYTYNSLPVIKSSCIQGLSLYEGNGNIGLDPLFVNTNGQDGIAGTEDDDLSLRPNSPCINAGSNAAVPGDMITDFDGLPRIHACIVDMGAYEYQENTYFGDADENCVIDLIDYQDFSFCLERFGYERNPILDACIEVFDSDGDKDVDLADFARFQRVFTGS